MVERSTGYKLIALRTDNGGEYTSTEFQSHLKKEGIKHELTVPRSPEQNGVAKRLNSTLVESVGSMLVGARLPQMFWAEALAVYLKNRSQTKSLNEFTPYEALQVSNHQLIISRCLVLQLMHTSQNKSEGSWIRKQRSASF